MRRAKSTGSPQAGRGSSAADAEHFERDYGQLIRMASPAFCRLGRTCRATAVSFIMRAAKTDGRSATAPRSAAATLVYCGDGTRIRRPKGGPKSGTFRRVTTATTIGR